MRARTDRRNARHGKTRWAFTIAAVVAILFGLLTLYAGGTALFGGPEARAAVGDAVPFVLWFNFVAGFAYIAAGIGLFRRRFWAVRLSIAILGATILVMIAFGVHVFLGGAYEMRTVVALSLRTVVWAIIVAVATRQAADFRPAVTRGRARPRLKTDNNGETK